MEEYQVFNRHSGANIGHSLHKREAIMVRGFLNGIYGEGFGIVKARDKAVESTPTDKQTHPGEVYDDDISELA